MKADTIQEEYDKKFNSLKPRIDKIKKAFKGDERTLMLNAFYKESHYNPVESLKGSLSLLLQIPFFITMYRFISSIKELHGVSFLFISDLGAPDRFLSLGGLSVNILPILMTLINIISGTVYSQKGQIRQKIQIYGLALIFLVLLYNSPSGLVIYWISNNVFSLLKNVVKKISSKRQPKNTTVEKRSKGDALIFFLSAVLLSLVTGMYVSSSVVKSSPAEFMDFVNIKTPVFYPVYSFAVSLGLWAFWGGVYFLLMSGPLQKKMSRVFMVISVFSLFNCLIFNRIRGTIDSTLVFEKAPEYKLWEIAVELSVIILIPVISLLIMKHKRKIMNYVLILAVISVAVMSVLNLIYIQIVTQDLADTPDQSEITFTLSRDHPNVVIIMMDRALNQDLPYIFDERPELREQFEGFTYYPNTVSFGPYTMHASPALYGGYEYTPEMINSRTDQTLVEKHDEALKVLPQLFLSADYNAYFFNPSYAGYSWIPDLSVFGDIPDLYVGNTGYKFDPIRDEVEETLRETRNRNFFFYGLYNLFPISIRNYVYDNGNYFEVERDTAVSATAPKVVSDDYLTSTGYDPTFDDAYSVLDNLPEITQISDEDTGSLVMMSNDTTHEATLLQLPDYTSAQYIDNTEYSEYYNDRILDGRVMHISTLFQLRNYQINMAAMIKLGEWMDYLRENDLYDNTRIIIVSDHGRNVDFFDDMHFGDLDIMQVNPLLLVKDFNSDDFTVSYEFMTNADVPSIATEGLFSDPVNPFTGNPINSNIKYEDPVHVYICDNYITDEPDSYTFSQGVWYSVHDDIMDLQNWEYLGVQ